MRLAMIALAVLYAYMSIYTLAWLQATFMPLTIDTISAGPIPEPSHPSELAFALQSALPFACTIALIVGLLLARARQLPLSELVMYVPVGMFAAIVALAP